MHPQQSGAGAEKALGRGDLEAKEKKVKILEHQRREVRMGLGGGSSTEDRGGFGLWGCVLGPCSAGTLCPQLLEVNKQWDQHFRAMKQKYEQKVGLGAVSSGLIPLCGEPAWGRGSGLCLAELQVAPMSPFPAGR